MVFLHCCDKDGNELFVRSDLIEWFSYSDRSRETQNWYAVKFSCFPEPLESDENEYFMQYILAL